MWTDKTSFSFVLISLKVNKWTHFIKMWIELFTNFYKNEKNITKMLIF